MLDNDGRTAQRAGVLEESNHSAIKSATTETTESSAAPLALLLPKRSRQENAFEKCCLRQRPIDGQAVAYIDLQRCVHGKRPDVPAPEISSFDLNL